MNTASVTTEKQKKLQSSPLVKNLKRNWTLYTMILPGVVIILVFNYLPMYGVSIAFQDFKPALGFFKSPFADPWYKYFVQLFSDVYFGRLVKNTLLLGLYNLLWTFPAPIILALLMNEIKHRQFKRVVQTISYMPYLLSTVIIIGILRLLVSTNGPVDVIMQYFGSSIPPLFQMSKAFRSLFIGSTLYATVGYNTIIYLAAISSVNIEHYEAAEIDGASRFQRILHITIPSILPTIVILFILAIPAIVGLPSVGTAGSDYTKVLIMYNEATYQTADVLGTYVYRAGVIGESTSYAAAANLFTSVFAFILVFVTNKIVSKLNETSLW